MPCPKVNRKSSRIMEERKKYLMKMGEQSD